jgi:uncharacterized protein
MSIKRFRFLKPVSVLALLLAVVYLAISSYIAYDLWHPVRNALHTTPAAYGLEYEDVQFPSAVDSIPLRGWFMDSVGTKTVLVLHGSNSVRDNYIGMEVSRALVQHNYDVFTFDFRGHGESGGDIGSLGALETRDISGALAYLRGRGISEVGAYALSMGAATELLAAPDHPEMRAIVADSSFADLFTLLDKERARNGIPSFFSPGILLVSKALLGIDPLENQPKRALTQLGDRPVLLIHSSVDDLIPVDDAYELQKAGAGNPNLELWVAQGSGHVTAFADNKDEYLRRLIAFFDTNLIGR